MRKKVRRRHEACVRAQTVCTDHGELFDSTPGGHTARMALDAHVADVDRLLALQERSIQNRRAATEQCRRSRRALRAAAKAIVRVGRVVNQDAAILDTMQVRGNANDDELLAYSRALLEHVSAYTDALVAQGLPPDLLTRLGDEISAFAAARGAQATSREQFTAATESILEALDGTGKVLDVLEAILENTPEAPPEVLTKLRIARRVGPRASAPPKAPPAAPADKAA